MAQNHEFPHFLLSFFIHLIIWSHYNSLLSLQNMDILDSDIIKLRFDQPIPKVGDILLAEPMMANSIFTRSTIVLIEHSDSMGSMGFITNHRSEYTLNELVEEIEREEEIPVYIGGPVRCNQMYYIHTLGDLIPESVEVAGGLYVSGDFNAIIEYVNSGAPIEGKIRFILGYSGWSKGQLEDELKNFDWAVANMCDTNTLLSTEEDTTWRKCVTMLDSRYWLWLNCPTSPHLN